MEISIARQPIFDKDETVFAYELPLRTSIEDVFARADPDQAAARVVADGFFLMGIETLGNHKPVVINATRNILVNDYFTLLPKALTLVEIEETVKPEPEVIGACSRLKSAGYKLVLGDFVHKEAYEALFPLADIIRVDFVTTGEADRKALVERHARSSVRLLAEKVDTREEFHKAVDLGYTYFQGDFFSKPSIISARDVPGFKLNYMRIIKEIQRPELDFKNLDEIIRLEVSVTYKLLRYINSAYFGLRNKVSSIMHAMLLLGEREFRKWVSFVALAGMGQDKPSELVIATLIRARFCESLAPMTGMAARADELFLLGMFSLLDAIMDRPLPDLLEEIPISDDIKKALLGEDSPLLGPYEYVLAYERGDWARLTQAVQGMDMDETGIPECYINAVEWAHKSFEEVRD
ncbi:MAG: EAL and HDOD domain-containing protein [Alphaproteobacteria bacterium]